MSEPTWQLLHSMEIPAKPPHGYWSRAVDYVEATKKLKFVVDDLIGSAPPAPGQLAAAPTPNRWNYAPDKECTADGDPRAPVNVADCLLTDAPPGALIGKIGGSTAGKKDSSQIFVVGSFCICEVDDKTKGPLYLTMNVDPMGALESSGKLFVSIFHSA